MASRKPSLFQQAQKEIRRLEKAARRVAKRGYTFELPFRKTKTGAEKIRYTRAEVERLSKLRTKDLYKYATYQTEYGTFTGTEYRKIERRVAARLGITRRQNRIDAQRYYEEAKARWEQEEYEREREEQYASVSGTIIDNAMQRKNWRWSDKYYEQFLSVVNKARAINIDQTAQAFQDMINSGVLIGIQKDYKPEDFWVDFSTFSEYFDDIMPESKELLSNQEDAFEEDYFDEEDFANMSDEEREFYISAFGGR